MKMIEMPTLPNIILYPQLDNAMQFRLDKINEIR